MNEVVSRFRFGAGLVRVLWRAWPLWFFLLGIFIHKQALGLLPFSDSAIHAGTALGLQLIGGLLVIFSIDQNLGLLNKSRLLGMAKNFALAILNFGKIQEIALGAAIATAHGLSASAEVVKAKTTKTLEQRVQELEKELGRLDERITEESKKIDKKLDDAMKKIRKQQSDLAQSVNDLRSKLESITVGGVKFQLLGVMYLVHGAIAAFLSAIS